MADLNVALTPLSVTDGQAGHAALHQQERDYIESLRSRPASGGGATTDLGSVLLDSFTGTTDDAKLTAAISQIGSESYPRGIQLSNRKYSFSIANRTPYEGMRIFGARGYGNPERGSAAKVGTQVSLTGTGPWFNASAQVFSVSLHNLSFTGGSASSILGGTGNWYCLSMRDIFASNLSSVLGTQASAMAVTAASFTGDWEVNNSYHGAFHLKGSDNVLWSDGMLLDASTAYLSAGASTGQYHLWLDSMDKSYIGPLYITCEGGWGGIRISGTAWNNVSTNMGSVVINGARIEGRNPDQPCSGSPIRVDGGRANIQDCFINYGMASPSAMGHSPVDAGMVHHSGGLLRLSGCQYDRATGVAETVPFVYTNTTGPCMVTQSWGASRGGAWTGTPRVAKPAGNAENRVVTDASVTLINV